MRGRHAPARDTRRSLLPTLLGAGILTALATTGGVLTAVGWTTDSTSGPFTVHAAAVPRMDPPAARTGVRPRLSWRPVRIADDVPVERYVVTRHLGTVAQVACDIPATAPPRCVDRYAPAGYRATYTVAARHGAHWTGADSEPSPVVTAPGVAVPISVNGMLIVPGAGGAPVVVGAAPVATDPSAAASSPALRPSAGPSGPVIDEPPVVHVPPAPPAGSGPDGDPPAGQHPDRNPPDKPQPGKDSPDKGPDHGPDKEPPGRTPDEPGTGPETESGAVKEPEPVASAPAAATAD